LNIQLMSSDRHSLTAHVAHPSGVVNGVVVVLQEIFGVNVHIRSIADRLALAGYVAIAPALFDRYQLGFEAGYDRDGVQRGMDIMKGFKREWALADTQAAIDFAREKYRASVAVVGFCLGGSLAWMSAASFPLSAAVGYYGGHIAQTNDLTPNCAVMLHFGTNDSHIPVSDVEKVKSAHPEVEVYLYDAGHGFNCDERSSFVAAAASQAWERTLMFLGQHLR
jgi:carboxymethylenebutenolidase